MDHEQQSVLEQLKTERDPERLVLLSQGLHAADLASVMADLSPDLRRHLFHALDNTTAAELLDELQPDLQHELLVDIPLSRASDIVEEMPADEAADLLGELPESRAEAILGAMETEEAEDVRELLDYEADTAGGQMTTEFIAVPESFTVEETIQRLRELAPDAETVYYLYVVDETEKLVGVVSLRALIVSNPSLQVAEIMDRDVISVPVEIDQEEAAELIARYNLVAVPVVDDEGRPIGIITVDDAVDVLDEEAAEDLYELEHKESSAGPFGTFGPRVFRAVWRLTAALLVAVYLRVLSGPGLQAPVGPGEAIYSQSWLALAFLPAMLLLSWAFQSQARASAMARPGFDRSDVPWRTLATEASVGAGLSLACACLCALVVYLLSRPTGAALAVGLGLAIGLGVSAGGAYVLPWLLAWRRPESVRRALTLVAHGLGTLVYLGIALGARS